MDKKEPIRYVEKITLEIVHRSGKFCVEKFQPRTAALAFLREYRGAILMNTEQVAIAYENERLNLIVRRVIFDNRQSPKSDNTIVEFLYRGILFSELKWCVTIDSEINSSSSMKNQLQMVHSDENADHFRSTIFIHFNHEMDKSNATSA